MISATTEEVARAHAKSHFAHAGDLASKMLSSGDVPPSSEHRSKILCQLAAAKRCGGHLSEALEASQEAQQSKNCGFEAHYEEGACWQELDCTRAAAACYQRALKLQPNHAPSLHGTKFCAMSEGTDITVEKQPGSESTLLLGGMTKRGTGIVAIPTALPDDFARSVALYLTSASDDQWRRNRRDNTTSATTSSRNVMAASMDYHMYVGPHLDSVIPSLRSKLRKALSLSSHERLLLNASKYLCGSYLAPHTDAPSASESHERARAFVWHLSLETFTKEDGGSFVDEESGQVFVPSFNTLVNFEVPRWHSVTKMETLGKVRMAIYGWIVVPKISLLEKRESLDLMLYQHRMVAVFCPSKDQLSTHRDTPHSLLLLFGSSAHRPPAVHSREKMSGGATACNRGDYVRFCVATKHWESSDDTSSSSSSQESSQESSLLLLYVDRRVVGRLPISATQWSKKDNDERQIMLAHVEHDWEKMLDSVWSHLEHPLPVLRGRTGWEDRWNITAMRFNRHLPLLAIVVGNNTTGNMGGRQSYGGGGGGGGGVVSEEVMQVALEIRNAMLGSVFVYVTTNSQLCRAFGGIEKQQMPTVVLHGRGGNGSDGMFRLVDETKSFQGIQGNNFDVIRIVRFVQRRIAHFS